MSCVCACACACGHEAVLGVLMRVLVLVCVRLAGRSYVRLRVCVVCALLLCEGDTRIW
jgi:hypothetical protein